MPDNLRLRVFILCSFLFLTQLVFAQNKQSIIYDAVSMLNGNHKLTVLVIPSGINKFDIVNPLTGEVEVHDTIALRPTDTDSIRGEDNVKVILRRNAGLADNASDADLIAAYQANPFLNTLVTRLTTKGPARLTLNSPNDALKMIPRFSGLSVPVDASGLGQTALSNIANGVADFLIKRAQEEISISVIAKLQQFLIRYPEIDTLFPKTCALIKPFEVYEYSKKLAAIRDAIHDDLRLLVSRISLLYSIPRYQMLNQKIPSLSLVFTAATIITDLDTAKMGMGRTLEDLGKQPYMVQDNNYTAVLKITCLLSNSLRAQTANNPNPNIFSYIAPSYIQEATQGNPSFFKELSEYYLGLIWQHSQDIFITSGNTRRAFSELLSQWTAQPVNGIQIVQDALMGMLVANQALKDIQALEDNLAQSRNTDAQKTIAHFKAYSKILESALALTELYISDPGASNTAFRQRIHEIRTYLPPFTQNATDMVEYFDEGKNNLGVNSFAKLVETVSQYLEDLEDSKYKVENTAIMSLIDGDISAQKTKVENDIKVLQAKIDSLPASGSAVRESADITAERLELNQLMAVLQAEEDKLLWQAKHSNQLLTKWSKIIEYMDLLASISQAENSAAVESLLETYALPAGSSRIKKDSKWNIAVNAYVGAFGRTNSPVKGFSATWGLTAPIGVAFSYGLGPKGNGGSLSAFLGVFDVGAIINYKLDNQGGYEQDINFAGIVSPSTQLVYGFFAHIPISVGFGCQWTSPPTVPANEINLQAHFNVFIAIDIPLFNLMAVKKK